MFNWFKNLFKRPENFNDWTPQQVFDKLVSLSERGEFPSVEDGRCKYRGKDGKKCAFGHFIPDCYYKERFEGQNICNIVKMRGVPKSVLPSFSFSLDLRFWLLIQQCHDNNSQMNWNHQRFVERLKSIFKEYKLEVVTK